MPMNKRLHDETVERIAAGIKRLRLEAGMSQTGLATKMRIAGEPWHQTTVSRVEAGYQEVSMIEMLALTRLFDCTLDDFVLSMDSDQASQ